MPTSTALKPNSSAGRLCGREPNSPCSGPASQLGNAAVDRGTRIDGCAAAYTAIAAVATISAPNASQAKNGPSAAHDTGSESRWPTDAARGSATAEPSRLIERARLIGNMVASAVPD